MGLALRRLNTSRAVDPDEPTLAPVRPGRRALVNALMLCSLGYFLLPLIWVVLSATKDNRDLINTFGLWFGDSFHLVENLEGLFTKDGGIFIRWMFNTALYAGLGAVGAALFAGMAGFALSKYRFRGRTALLVITVGAIMVPPQTLVLPTFLLLSKVGMTGTEFSVIVPMMVSPIGVFLMKVYADAAVPDELLDAARVDGSGDLRIFSTIAFRLLLPGFVTVFLLKLVDNWNNFFLPLVMLGDDHQYPVTVGLTNWIELATSGHEVAFSVVVTGALVAIVPVIVVFVTMQRYWESGLALGSGK